VIYNWLHMVISSALGPNTKSSWTTRLQEHSNQAVLYVTPECRCSSVLWRKNHLKEGILHHTLHVSMLRRG
jgi:hypothetical protein